MFSKTMIIGIVFMVIGSTYLHADTLTPRVCRERAIAAAQLIKESGPEAFALLKDPLGPFVFSGQSTR